VKESQQKQRDVKLSEEAKLALEKKKYGPHGQYTALHFIVLKQRTEDLAEFLKFQPLDLNKVDLDGRTPLHIAISLKSELAFLLLDAGADVNIV
jgi:ankyrin repeat protein